MSQMTWTYIADDGAHYTIGLYHGETSGHLLVYCNDEIMVIDFSVKTSRKYTFFINDELFSLELEEKEGLFRYGFSIDQVADTPRNRKRHLMERTEVRQTLLLALIIIVILATVIFLLFRFNG